MNLSFFFKKKDVNWNFINQTDLSFNMLVFDWLII